jgi:adenine-specific DNA glycosylase
MIKMGCFGSVVAFSPKTKTCQDCPVNKQCAAEVFSKEETTLQAIERKETERDTEDATLFSKKHHKIEDLPNAAYHKVKRFFATRRRYFTAKATGKPIGRAAKDYEAMMKNGIDFTMMRMRLNPFKEGGHYPHMRKIVGIIFDLEYFKTKDVAEELKKQGYNSHKSTSSTLASRGIKVLEMAGVIKNDGGTYCLS